ncbi:thioredoxin-like protein [Nitzschia inconspicua]|uniref:Thioredoxin-like protein n=1 Tax=Nitzschia inconspicua TaxID=303405 RepID=A0A9K3M4Z2_9STRA|nr:thioredoxin-like protein [Nitzschia inconspicua]
MQKRRGHLSSSLPMTEADVVKMSGGMNIILGGPGRTALPGKKRRKARNAVRGRRDYRRVWGLLLVGTLGTILLYLLSTSSKHNEDSDVAATGGGIKGMIQWHRQRRRHNQKQAIIKKPLDHFSTLQYALQHSHLVALYFAASWCPHSTPVTEALDEYFSDLILPPKSDDEDEAGTKVTEPFPLAIVHVSSDTKEAKFREYMRKNWIAVPFDSPERTSLKRHFQVCAKPEVELLGIDRKYEIPTLLIIDSATQTVLTTNGVDDLEEFKDKALEHWTELHGLVRGMDEKYAEREEEEEQKEDDDGLAREPARDRHRRAKHGDGNAAGAVGELFGPN